MADNDRARRAAMAERLKQERPKLWAKVQEAVYVRGANQVTGTVAALNEYLKNEAEIARLLSPKENK